MIKIICQNCNHEIGAPDSYAGKRARCPKCKAPIQIGQPTEHKAPQETKLIKFNCPSCGQSIKVKSEHAGKNARCPRCKNPLRVPEYEQKPAVKGPLGDMSNMDELLAAEANAPSVGRPAVTSPAKDEVDEGGFYGYENQTGGTSSFGRGGAEPSSKNRLMILIGAVCFVVLVAVGGIAAWYFSSGSEGVSSKRDVRAQSTEKISKKRTVESEEYEAEDDGVVLFSIVTENLKQGFIDRTGKVVIKPKFELVGLIGQDFSEGLVCVGIGKEFGYIDRKSKTRFTLGPRYQLASPFSEGLASVGIVVKDEIKYGYIDKKGRLVIDARFSSTNDFSEGLACVQVGGKAGGMLGGTYGYIDKAGKYIVEPKFDWAQDFHEGLACVRTGGRRGGLLGEKVGGKTGFIDKSGQYVIESRFEWATSFSEGLAVVHVGRKAGFIDKTGEVVIAAVFDGAVPFSEGLACVTVKGLHGYIDRSGNFVIKPKFKMATHSFSDGLALVCEDSKFGYIDKTGTFVIEPKFDFGSHFKNGLAQVSTSKLRGYIDKNGSFVWKRRD